ncbi:MAG: Rieske (2Fe-2S) protein [Chloroflexi bacterium]|nr:Rieske (2Fe-2S) protein [Chloroflexota bacterium]
MHNTHLTLANLQAQGCLVYQSETHPVAIFYTDGGLYAVDNRCPHMGFPLAQGSVKDGILTCHWHHARFALGSGGALDLFADDVRAFPVEARDGEIWIDLTPLPPEVQRARLTRRLQHGLERDLNLVIAKTVIALVRDTPSGLSAAGRGEAARGEHRVSEEANRAPLRPYEAARVPFATGLEFGARNRRDGWAMGQTIHVAMMNLLPFLDQEDAARALYHGLSAVARDCDGAPARHLLDPLPGGAVEMSTLKRWFRSFVEVRDEEGAERCIVTAAQAGASPAHISDMLFSAATDHRYLQIGHTADFSNKAIEACEHLDGADGRPLAGLVLSSLAPSFANASRAEESNAWRNPVDLIALLEAAYERLPQALDDGRRPSTSSGRRAQDPLAVRPATHLADLTDTLLSDRPHDIVAVLLDALQHGTTPEQLAGAVTYAAARRMAHFHTSNEFGDWDTVLHTFTFANAIHQAMRRAPSVALLRGVFDAAMSVYLDRFLNMPAAKIPQVERSGETPEDLRDEFLSLLNRQQQVNESAALCVQYLINGGAPERLMAAIGKALLREDPGFHTIQTVEAAFAQYRLWRGTPQADHFLIAAARYLAAHAPTSRAMEQTFRIAWRLHRGDRLFIEE